MTEVTAQARHKQSREATLEEVSLQTSAKSRQRVHLYVRVSMTLMYIYVSGITCCMLLPWF